MDSFLRDKRLSISAIGEVFASALLVGCSSGEASTVAHLGPHANMREMVALADDSYSLVRQSVPDAVLRQVDYYAEGYVFRFTDAALTNSVVVFALARTNPEQWKVVDEGTPIYGLPSSGLDLAAVVVGPESVLEMARKHWSTGDFSGFGLGGDGQNITWYVGWNLPEGTVSANVDAVTGEFTASSAPPAMVAPTARPG